MIKINELRQGNLVMLNGEVVGWDWSLFGQSANVLYKSSGSEVTAEPISLSEEWLVKFGFEPCGEANYKTFHNQEIKANVSLTGNYAHYRDDPRSRPFVIIDGDKIWLDRQRLKYTHQLQNLYFTLTGKELIVKDME